MSNLITVAILMSLSSWPTRAGVNSYIEENPFIWSNLRVFKQIRKDNNFPDANKESFDDYIRQVLEIVAGRPAIQIAPATLENFQDNFMDIERHSKMTTDIYQTIIHDLSRLAAKFSITKEQFKTAYHEVQKWLTNQRDEMHNKHLDWMLAFYNSMSPEEYKKLTRDILGMVYMLISEILTIFSIKFLPYADLDADKNQQINSVVMESLKVLADTEDFCQNDDLNDKDTTITFAVLRDNAHLFPQLDTLCKTKIEKMETKITEILENFLKNQDALIEVATYRERTDALLVWLTSALFDNHYYLAFAKATQNYPELVTALESKETQLMELICSKPKGENLNSPLKFVGIIGYFSYHNY